MGSASTSVNDRRVAPRFEHRSMAQLVLCPSSRRKSRCNVQVADYSVTGIGITNFEPLPIGQKYIVIEPSITRGGSTIYTVVRCDQKPDGTYSIGLQMCNTIRDPVEQMMDEIIPLPDPTPRPSWIHRLVSRLTTK